MGGSSGCRRVLVWRRCILQLAERRGRTRSLLRCRNLDLRFQRLGLSASDRSRVGEGRTRNDGRARVLVGKQLRLCTHQRLELCTVHGSSRRSGLLDRCFAVRLPAHDRQRLGVVSGLVRSRLLPERLWHQPSGAGIGKPSRGPRWLVRGLGARVLTMFLSGCLPTIGLVG